VNVAYNRVQIINKLARDQDAHRKFKLAHALPVVPEVPFDEDMNGYGNAKVPKCRCLILYLHNHFLARLLVTPLVLAQGQGELGRGEEP